VWPRVVAFFNTRLNIDIKGTIAGHAFASPVMALGDGTHKLPIKSEVWKRIKKEVGDTVIIHLKERMGIWRGMDFLVIG